MPKEGTLKMTETAPLIGANLVPVRSTATVELDSVLASEVAPQRLLVERGVPAEVANVITDPLVDGLYVRFQGLKKGSKFAWFAALQ